MRQVIHKSNKQAYLNGTNIFAICDWIEHKSKNVTRTDIIYILEYQHRLSKEEVIWFEAPVGGIPQSVHHTVETPPRQGIDHDKLK